MNELFEKRAEEYFADKSQSFLKLLAEKPTQGLFLNTRKASKEEILDLLDFEYQRSELTDDSYYHNEDNIGKSIAYELGLIYPQEIAASLTTKYIDRKDINIVVDICAAPGGKTINILNRLDPDVLCISNDVKHDRSLILSSNLERCGLDNVIVTSKETSKLADELQGQADIVILDAPCSGEGMIRKYPEILEEYSLKNINSLARLQSELLEDAYRLLAPGGQLVYSTCTYAFEEDEDQISSFLERHNDISLISIDLPSSSKMPGTVKLSPLNKTEGQFFALMRKDGKKNDGNLRYLKPTKEKTVEDFVKENLDINEYYLYKNNDRFYLSLKPLIDLKNNVLKYGINIGEIRNRRFEPNHNLYRANSLKGLYHYKYDLNDEEYARFISGNEFRADLSNHYYLITYKGHSLGFGKCSNGAMKNKYPKGLRRMI